MIDSAMLLEVLALIGGALRFLEAVNEGFQAGLKAFLDRKGKGGSDGSQ